MGSATVYIKQPSSDSLVVSISSNIFDISLDSWSQLARHKGRGKGEANDEVSCHGDGALTKNTALERQLSRSDSFEGKCERKLYREYSKLLKAFLLRKDIDKAPCSGIHLQSYNGPSLPEIKGVARMKQILQKL